ncbi:hypothetical protein SO802_028723 [Lithocarpus litseifolius]|uniref:Uncharacterized protein n=1 Tax=Lithocarpus litseifolius TaxID=425828 RepID=A0AAW2BU90_9ROSI
MARGNSLVDLDNSQLRDTHRVIPPTSNQTETKEQFPNDLLRVDTLFKKAREAGINIETRERGKKDVSCESDLKDAVDVSLPLIHAALRDIEKGTFPKNFFLNIEIPSSP